jgi:hypothetical protein
MIYALAAWGGGGMRAKVYLDLFRLGNRRTVLDAQELHDLGEDENGNPTAPNSNFGLPLRFQPPVSARIGLSLDFGELD